MTSSPISLPSSPTRPKSHNVPRSLGPPMVRLYSLVSQTTSSGSGSLLHRYHCRYESMEIFAGTLIVHDPVLPTSNPFIEHVLQVVLVGIGIVSFSLNLVLVKLEV